MGINWIFISTCLLFLLSVMTSFQLEILPIHECQLRIKYGEEQSVSISDKLYAPFPQGQKQSFPSVNVFGTFL